MISTRFQLGKLRNMHSIVMHGLFLYSDNNVHVELLFVLLMSEVQ